MFVDGDVQNSPCPVEYGSGRVTHVLYGRLDLWPPASALDSRLVDDIFQVCFRFGRRFLDSFRLRLSFSFGLRGRRRLIQSSTNQNGHRFLIETVLSGTGPDVRSLLDSGLAYRPVSFAGDTLLQRGKLTICGTKVELNFWGTSTLLLFGRGGIGHGCRRCCGGVGVIRSSGWSRASRRRLRVRGVGEATHFEAEVRALLFRVVGVLVFLRCVCC